MGELSELVTSRVLGATYAIAGRIRAVKRAGA